MPSACARAAKQKRRVQCAVCGSSRFPSTSCGCVQENAFSRGDTFDDLRPRPVAPPDADGPHLGLKTLQYIDNASTVLLAYCACGNREHCSRLQHDLDV